MLRMIVVAFTVLLALVGFGQFDASHSTGYDPLPMSEPTPVEKFMHQIAMIESYDHNRGIRHDVVNPFGMMGKYQFSPTTVRMLGFRHSKNEFLKNPHLQDSVMLTYMYVNQQELEQLIDRYEGKTVKGVKMTRATILAGAHFAGSGGMRKFLTDPNDEGVKDAFGTTLPVYMKKFSNIHLPPIIL
jgi:hypothetical protein